MLFILIELRILDIVSAILSNEPYQTVPFLIFAMYLSMPGPKRSSPSSSSESPPASSKGSFTISSAPSLYSASEKNGAGEEGGISDWGSSDPAGRSLGCPSTLSLLLLRSKLDYRKGKPHEPFCNVFFRSINCCSSRYHFDLLLLEEKHRDRLRLFKKKVKEKKTS